ncbi:MAG: WXG100 family type VII secretion target [Bacilli bacterium]|nr:WXG100 family type VII secretion target [Bacilli bacterium]
MNEFEEKDYEGARSYANAVKTNADNIMGIFNDIDATMNNLYSNNWASIGADDAQARYNEIRKNYEVFYEKVIAMKNHVYRVTARNEEADKAANATVTSV